MKTAWLLFVATAMILLYLSCQKEIPERSSVKSEIIIEIVPNSNDSGGDPEGNSNSDNNGPTSNFITASSRVAYISGRPYILLSNGNSQNGYSLSLVDIESEQVSKIESAPNLLYPGEINLHRVNNQTLGIAYRSRGSNNTGEVLYKEYHNNSLSNPLIIANNPDPGFFPSQVSHTSGDQFISYFDKTCDKIWSTRIHTTSNNLQFFSISNCGTDYCQVFSVIKGNKLYLLAKENQSYQPLTLFELDAGNGTVEQALLDYTVTANLDFQSNNLGQPTALYQKGDAILLGQLSDSSWESSFITSVSGATSGSLIFDVANRPIVLLKSAEKLQAFLFESGNWQTIYTFDTNPSYHLSSAGPPSIFREAGNKITIFFTDASGIYYDEFSY
jgi:hypothetical protein